MIKIEAGMKVPADCILFDGIDVKADESSLTGEPEPMDKFAVNPSNI